MNDTIDSEDRRRAPLRCSDRVRPAGAVDTRHLVEAAGIGITADEGAACPAGPEDS